MIGSVKKIKQNRGLEVGGWDLGVPLGEVISRHLNGEYSLVWCLRTKHSGSGNIMIRTLSSETGSSVFKESKTRVAGLEYIRRRVGNKFREALRSWLMQSHVKGYDFYLK